MISLAFIIFAASCATSTSTTPTPKIAADLPRKHMLDKVPKYYAMQGDSCGPASMRMVFAYYGVKIPRTKLARDLEDYSRSTGLIQMMEYPKTLGFKVEEKTGTISDIARNIAQGRPVIVAQWANQEYRLRRLPEGMHARVVIGYDADLEKVYMRDPFYPGITVASFKEFNELWDIDTFDFGSLSKNWMLVVYK
jgi:ABC-type bacteriocin/lantibiotic exporter with double-glycine peptidase domain